MTTSAPRGFIFSAISSESTDVITLAPNAFAMGMATEAQYRYFYDVSNQLVKTLDITNKKLYNITRVGDNVTQIEEYNVTLSGETVTAKTLVGTMYYRFAFGMKG